MSLKAELETWTAALKAYDEEDFERSLELFSTIADASKILTNIGLIYATLGEHELAVENYNTATTLDPYLAVAYFQCGVSNFLLGRYEMALKDFEDALLYLRGNQAINYEQLGLKFKVYSAEVLFNKGLSLIYLGRMEEGLRDLQDASQEKVTEEHKVIDDALAEQGAGYTVFSIPVGILYRPPEKKISNLTSKDYLGKAKLIAAEDARDAYTTFTGVTRLQQGMTPVGAPLDQPNSSLERSASAGAALPKPPADPARLQRSATTINVVSPQQRQARLDAAAPPAAMPPPSAMANPGGMTRTMSTRAMNAPAPLRPARSPQEPSPRDMGGPLAPPKPAQASRITEIYDNYLDVYDNEDVPPLPTQSVDGKQRVAQWAKNSGNLARRPSAPSSYAPSSFGGAGGGPMRRKSSRRANYAPKSVVSGSRSTVYEEEEEGYVSGDYDDGMELRSIRVKLHYRDEARGMAITPDLPFDEFLDRVTAKFGIAMSMKFKDEDGTKVTLRDESDFDMAIETARDQAKGRPEGKLEIWCADT